MASYIPNYQKKRRRLESAVKQLVKSIEQNDHLSTDKLVRVVKEKAISVVKSELSQVQPQGKLIADIAMWESKLVKWESIETDEIIMMVKSGNYKLV